LASLFGDVPLVTSSNYLLSSTAKRTPKAQVYAQIVKDLTDAAANLNPNYLESDCITSKSSTERLRPNRSAAFALLARVYLYQGDWADAEKDAGLVIANSIYTLPTDLNTVFLRGSQEAIWQVGLAKANTVEGSFFQLVLPPGEFGIGALSPQLINVFEPGDARWTNWVGNVSFDDITTYYFPYKYKVFHSSTVTEYEMILRLAEQYLIRAEARAEGAGEGLPGAVADLNTIRHRAGLPDYTGAENDKDAVLAAIAHERQVELFTEGHRWLDLKRTGQIDVVMSKVTPTKHGTWNTHQQLYPIPAAEIKVNNNLTQNSGY
jgi:hypothetical protein